ncbi:MAG TPA: pitrilysin family protein [Terriglobia bacterium]|nr:pitrilysin family protein [Terriglobia bacterium]
MNDIRKEVLENGLTVLTERMPHVRSISLGIWLRMGSRNEAAEVNGVAHFIEHLLFKGTTNRSGEEIARQVDSIGGHLDAFTAKETICYSSKVLDEHLPLAFDILSDLVLNPKFDAGDIEKERGVVLEEIKMVEDTPDDLVNEIFTQNFWKDHPLGRPILGTKQTITRLDREKVLQFFHEFYIPEVIVVSVAGNLDHERVVDLVRSRFGTILAHRNGYLEAPAHTHSRITIRSKKELEQVHICMGVPACPLSHDDRYACYVLNTILGGGMSSRLFQNIREKQGLAYAIYSGLNSYKDTGCLSVYAGTSLETTERVVDLIVSEFRNLKHQPVEVEELRRAKDYLKGSLMLGLESTSSRMSNLARQEMYFGRYFTLDEMASQIETVTSEDLRRLGQNFFDTRHIALTVLGNLDGFRITRERLDCN